MLIQLDICQKEIVKHGSAPLLSGWQRSIDFRPLWQGITPLETENRLHPHERGPHATEPGAEGEQHFIDWGRGRKNQHGLEWCWDSFSNPISVFDCAYKWRRFFFFSLSTSVTYFKGQSWFHWAVVKLNKWWNETSESIKWKYRIESIEKI